MMGRAHTLAPPHTATRSRGPPPIARVNTRHCADHWSQGINSHPFLTGNKIHRHYRQPSHDTPASIKSESGQLSLYLVSTASKTQKTKNPQTVRKHLEKVDAYESFCSETLGPHKVFGLHMFTDIPTVEAFIRRQQQECETGGKPKWSDGSVHNFLATATWVLMFLSQKDLYKDIAEQSLGHIKKMQRSYLTAARSSREAKTADSVRAELRNTAKQIK